MKDNKIKMAIELLNKYSQEEFGNDVDINDLEDINIAYSTSEDGFVEIQCSVDIIDNKLNTYWNSILVKEEKFNDKEFMDILKNLDFENLIYEGENI